MMGLWWAVAWGGRPTAPIPQAPPPSTNTKLSAADLAFGRQQVDQMMHDRPQMATYVERGDIVYLWAVRQFAGEAAGQRIYWSNSAPDCPAWCLSITHTVEGDIAIRERYAEGPQRGQDLSGELVWSCAVFELYNISKLNQLKAIGEVARSGKISKQEFVTECTKLEFGSEQRTTLFYHILWRPLAEKQAQETNENYWFTDNPDTYRKWIQQFKGGEDYPYGYYNSFYDQNIAPYLER